MGGGGKIIANNLKKGLKLPVVSMAY